MENLTAEQILEGKSREKKLSVDGICVIAKMNDGTYRQIYIKSEYDKTILKMIAAISPDETLQVSNERLFGIEF